MINIDRMDRDVLRFLWFDDPNKSDSGITTYRFCRVPFGLISSPAILNSTIKHHLNTMLPKVDNNFYVDD